MTGQDSAEWFIMSCPVLLPGDAQSGEIRLYLKKDDAMPEMEILTKRSVCAYSYQKDDAFQMESGRLYRNVPMFTDDSDTQGADEGQTELDRLNMKKDNEVEYISLRWEPGSGGDFLAFLSSSAATAQLVIRDAVFYPDNDGGSELAPYVWGVVGVAIGLLLAGVAWYILRRRSKAAQYEKQDLVEGANGFMEMNSSYTQDEHYTDNGTSYVKTKQIQQQQSEMMNMLSKLHGRLEVCQRGSSPCCLCSRLKGHVTDERQDVRVDVVSLADVPPWLVCPLDCTVEHGVKYD